MLETGGKPLRPFEELFEPALQFLAIPCKVWASDRLRDKQAVLKLTFAERLTYDRSQGFLTPRTSLIFRALKGNETENFEMAEGAGFEPAVGVNPRWFSRPLP